MMNMWCAVHDFDVLLMNDMSMLMPCIAVNARLRMMIRLWYDRWYDRKAMDAY